MKSVVMLFDARKGEFVKEAICTLSPMKAMVSAVMQYKRDFNTQNYPSKLMEYISQMLSKTGFYIIYLMI